MLVKTIVLFVLFSFARTAAAAESVQGAVVTRAEGNAFFLIKKNGAQPQDTQPIVFESITYYKRPLKKGDRPSNGDVIITDRDGKARLIFRNGDQITVTPGTAYKFSWDPNTQKNALAELIYGDIRAVIQPGGPREGMKVKTKSAVMGVRGTDFYASGWDAHGGSKVAVIRGKVAVAAVDDAGKMLKTVDIPAGSTGVVPSQPSQKKKEDVVASVSEVKVESTSKEQLVVIQKDSKVAVLTAKDDTSSAETKKELAELENQAVETTLKDIQKYDPSLYEKIKTDQTKGAKLDSDGLQAESVKKIFASAPSEAKAVRKPTLEDLDSGGDIYEKYKWKKER